MGNRLLRMVTVLSFSFAAGNAAGQIYPGEEIQGKMFVEEQAFLANMKEGLQHVQMLAVRDAMKGDYGALEEIRQSRNKAPVLPENIDIKYVASDICLFSPAGRAARKRPLLLYLHGGGWCFGSINSCARFCATLAEAGDCCVAALNYRLAPKFPFPAPLDDCRRAFEYVKCHADEWGCDSLQVSVGGDSAGGNLALATAMSVEGACKVISIYPVTKLYTEVTPSWVEYGKGYGDDAELLEAFNEAYSGGAARNPLVSVGLASDETLAKLPPVLIISAGHDILFDQTAEFAERLHGLGNSLSYHVFPTATHLFITVPGQPTAFNESVRIVAEFINGRGCFPTTFMGATKDARAVAGPWRFASLIPSGCRLTPIHKVMGDHASMPPPPPGLVLRRKFRGWCERQNVMFSVVWRER